MGAHLETGTVRCRFRVPMRTLMLIVLRTAPPPVAGEGCRGGRVRVTAVRVSQFLGGFEERLGPLYSNDRVVGSTDIGGAVVYKQPVCESGLPVRRHEKGSPCLFLGMLMLPVDWKKFVHPGGVYGLEYPAHWDHLEKDDARSCGFGPHERDDVGLWISIMPVSLDTERLADELPKILSQVLPNMEGDNIRRDPSLRHYGVKADVQKEGEGGHYWLIAGGDVVLFASSELPVAERDMWNPTFERLMSSLEITRDEELALRKLSNEVLEMLRSRHPEQEFKADEKGIRGRNRVVFLSNLFREVRAAPGRAAQIIEHFVSSLGQSMDLSLGYETWEDAQVRLLPLLKPRSYLDSGSAARNSLVNEWLEDVVICYACEATTSTAS